MLVSVVYAVSISMSQAVRLAELSTYTINPLPGFLSSSVVLKLPELVSCSVLADEQATEISHDNDLLVPQWLSQCRSVCVGCSRCNLG